MKKGIGSVGKSRRVPSSMRQIAERAGYKSSQVGLQQNLGLVGKLCCQGMRHGVCPRSQLSDVDHV